jgi:hypothetical protein
MAYVDGNPKSKKEIKEKLLRGEVVTCFQPGLGPPLEHFTGTVSLEGPHYPAAHKWYAEGTLKDGKLVRIK